MCRKEVKLTVLEKIQNLVLPLPVSLTTCRAKKKDPATDNIIPISWAGIIEYNPDMLYIGIGAKKYSAGVIEERKEFGFCIATVNMMKKVDQCGCCHGNEVDKFRLTSFTKFEAKEIDVSLIKECPICLECKVTEVVKVKKHKLFFAEVVCTYVEEKFLDDKKEPLLSEMDILCNVNDQYWTLGKKLEDLGYTE
jgi:flavin reductase (DIM6/NTAB) family NADH-FMN oxidoreductase RutF